MYDSWNSKYKTKTDTNISFAAELTRAEKEQVIKDRIEYLTEKIKNGDTEVSYQIGASSFTEREWDEIIEKYDDIQEELKEMMREEREKMEAKEIIKEKEKRDRLNNED